MRTNSCFLVAVAVLFGIGTQATASIITLTYNDSEAGGAGFGAPGVHQSQLLLDGIDHTVTASYSAASATTTTNFAQTDANTVVLGWSGNQTRVGEAWVRSNSYTDVRFTADQNSLTYGIDGLYQVTSLNPQDPGRAVLISSFEDLTLGQLLFYRQQYSNRANASIDIDTTSPDTVVILEGSATGSLVKGHVYRFTIGVYTEPYGESDGGAVGTGVAALTITSAVPEPASLAIWGGLGIAGLVAARRRKKVTA